jgi:hypothetical protein
MHTMYALFQPFAWMERSTSTCSMKMAIAIVSLLMCTLTFVMMTNTEESVAQTTVRYLYKQ